MSIKDELKKSIPSNLKLNEHEKNRIRQKVQQPIQKRRSFKPVFISVLFVALVGILILPNLSFFNHESAASQPTPMSEPEQQRLVNLTDEEKKALHKEYERIVQEANQLKIGLQLEVESIEKFEDPYWVTVEQFEKRIQNMVQAEIAKEKEAVKDATPNIKEAITNVHGETTKGTFTMISGIFKEIEATATFKTAYNAEQKRHIFVGIDNVSSEFAYKNRGQWEQVSYDANIINDGQTYKIDIEGIFNYPELKITVEKVFTIEFHCNPDGSIS